MDARTNIKARLPSRHGTEGPARAPHWAYDDAPGLTTEQIHQAFVGVASCGNGAAPCKISLMRQAQAVKKSSAAADFSTTVTDGIAMGHAGMRASPPSGEALTLFDVAEVFKKTPYIADLKPSGRHVAKDMFEVGGVPLLMKTSLDHGYLRGDCLTVTGRTIAENLKSVKSNPNQDVVRPADKPIAGVGCETDFTSGYLRKYARQIGSALNGAAPRPAGKAEKLSYADA